MIIDTRCRAVTPLPLLLPLLAITLRLLLLCAYAMILHDYAINT